MKTVFPVRLSNGSAFSESTSGPFREILSALSQVSGLRGTVTMYDLQTQKTHFANVGTTANLVDTLRRECSGLYKQTPMVVEPKGDNGYHLEMSSSHKIQKGSEELPVWKVSADVHYKS